MSERALTVRDVARHDVLTVTEAAEELRVHRKTVYAWIKAGKLGTLKLPGGDIRIPREHLEAFKCPAKNSPDQTTGSSDQKRSGQSTTQIRSPVILDAYRLGRLTASRPKSGGTNG
jgi:excisionase family DNA binding protein